MALNLGTTAVKKINIVKNNETVALTKVYVSKDGELTLVWSSAPSTIYQNGTLNPEIFSDFSNGLSIQANASASDSSGTGAGGWGSGSASTSATSTELGSLTGVRITGDINLYTYSWSQHQASGSAAFSWSGGSKQLTNISHSCSGSPDYDVNSNKSFDVTINGEFSDNETFTFSVSTSIGVFGIQGAGGGAALTITGIYPISD